MIDLGKGSYKKLKEVANGYRIVEEYRWTNLQIDKKEKV